MEKSKSETSRFGTIRQVVGFLARRAFLDGNGRFHIGASTASMATGWYLYHNAHQAPEVFSTNPQNNMGTHIDLPALPSMSTEWSLELVDQAEQIVDGRTNTDG
jgi:hypothetical protein